MKKFKVIMNVKKGDQDFNEGLCMEAEDLKNAILYANGRFIYEISKNPKSFYHGARITILSVTYPFLLTEAESKATAQSIKDGNHDAALQIGMAVSVTANVFKQLEAVHKDVMEKVSKFQITEPIPPGRICDDCKEFCACSTVHGVKPGQDYCGYFPARFRDNKSMRSVTLC